MGQYVVCHQAIALGGFFALSIGAPVRQILHALANGNTLRAAMFPSGVFLKPGKGLVAAVVDDLQHAEQGITIHDGRNQYLFGAEA